MAPRKTTKVNTPTAKQLREQIEVERLQFELQSVKQLSESINVSNSFVPPWDLCPQGDGFSGGYPGNFMGFMQIDRNKRGDLPEAYLSPQHLAWARRRSRSLSVNNEYARNALVNRQNYIAGQGFQVSPVAREADGELDEEIERQLQDFIEEFSAINNWGLKQREAVMRGDRDGDGAFRLFERPDGMTEVRFVEAEFIVSETDGATYGIETEPNDPAKATGFWIKYPEQEPELVPAEEIVFFKLNTDEGVKRGLPFLYPIFETLEHIEKINRNTGLMIAIQSSIAMIRKNGVARKSSIQTNQASQAGYTNNNLATGQTEYNRPMRGGAIYDVDANTEYEFPAAGVSIPGFVAGRQSLLQTAAAGVSMPEYMLTGDLSNGNFASTQVGESPAVMNFMSMQYYWKHIFGSGVYFEGADNGVLWRAIKYAVEQKRLPEVVLQDVRLECTGPSVEVRDKNQETDRLLKLEEAGVVDNDHVAKTLGHSKARVSSEEKEVRKADEMKQQLAAKSQQVAKKPAKKK